MKAADRSIAMSLNMTLLHDRMENGTNYDTILAEMVDIADEELAHMPQIELPDITSYENAKKHLYVEVVGADRNMVAGGYSLQRSLYGDSSFQKDSN